MTAVASKDHRVDICIPRDIEDLEPVRGFNEGDIDAVVIPGVMHLTESRHGVAIAPDKDTTILLNRDAHGIVAEHSLWDWPQGEVDEVRLHHDRGAGPCGTHRSYRQHVHVASRQEQERKRA